MTNKRRRRLAGAALPAAGLAVVAGALALSGQAASAAPQADGAGEGGDAAASAMDRAQEVSDRAQTMADLAQVEIPDATDSEADTEEDEGSKGPADLPAAAKFGSGVSHIASGHNAGILNGTQVVAPITVDLDVCGNSIAAVGAASAACGGDDEEEPPPPPVDEEPPTAQEPPPVPLPTPVDEPPVAEPELPKTGLPVGSIAGLGGLLTAGGAAMQLAGVRAGRYTGRHRRGPRPS